MWTIRNMTLTLLSILLQQLRCHCEGSCQRCLSSNQTLQELKKPSKWSDKVLLTSVSAKRISQVANLWSSTNMLPCMAVLIKGVNPKFCVLKSSPGVSTQQRWPQTRSTTSTTSIWLRQRNPTLSTTWRIRTTSQLPVSCLEFKITRKGKVS